MQTACHGVEVSEVGHDPGGQLFALHARIDPFKRFLEDRRDALGLVGVAVVLDLKNRLFGSRHQVLGVDRLVVSVLKDFGRSVDQASDDRFGLDDLGVVDGVSGVWDAVCQVGQIGCTADQIEFVGGFELIDQQRDIDPFARIVQPRHGLE